MSREEFEAEQERLRAMMGRETRDSLDFAAAFAQVVRSSSDDSLEREACAVVMRDPIAFRYHVERVLQEVGR